MTGNCEKCKVSTNAIIVMMMITKTGIFEIMILKTIWY